MAGDASIWTTLLAVIVGGAIGVSGSWIIERRKEKSERKRHRENKFEEAVTAVYEFDHWLDKYRLDTAIGKEQQMTSSPFAKLEGIVALHFPELSERTSTLASAAREYQLYLAQAGGKRLEGKI